MNSEMLNGVQLIAGDSVTVVRPSVTVETDDMGEPMAGEPKRETVVNVLFDPTASSDVSGNLRAANIRVDAEFHFPKAYTRPLRGCRIEYGGVSYRVIGDIRRYQPENVPGPWNGVVAAEAVS